MPETLERPHGQLCVWCDVEEFMEKPYGSLHHLTVRAIAKMQAEREREMAALPFQGLR